MNFELMIAIGVNLLGLGAAYGGIRAEIRNLSQGVQEAKASARRAHERLDNFIEQRNPL